MLPLRPDMASLSVGSNNFPTRVYENPPDLVDWLASEMLTHEVKPEIEAFDSVPHPQGRRDGPGRATRRARLTSSSSWA
jgi:3-keto-5-aminohexanoate cleavage enzyme